MNINKGQIYRHFKGDLMKVIEIAKHTETEELMVIYEHNGIVRARQYEMFISKVDKNKYPEIKQEYRFELVK